MNKITTGLRNYLNKSNPHEDISVVIELVPLDITHQSDLSRNKKIALLQEAFQKEVQPVKEAILLVGGNVLQMAWLNQTVEATIPVKSISTLAKLDVVTAIDLPNKLVTG